jgi:HK97 family phage prohead protease
MEPILLSKTFSAKAEATEGGSPGEFEAIVSAFGNEDSQGDVVEKGAFTNTLEEWIEKGRPIPVVWSHQFHDPENFLGKYVDAEETDAGLKLKGLFDMEHPKAARVHKLMKQGLIVEFSISGRVRDYELIKDEDADEDDFWASWFAPMRIKDIDLWEAGPCFKGANPDTELLSIKNLGPRQFEALHKSFIAKEGRVLAQKHVDSLKEAHAKLGDIIAAVEKTEPADAEAEKTVQLVTPNVRALLELNTIH